MSATMSSAFTADGHNAHERLFRGGNLVIERLCNELGDFRSRIEALEAPMAELRAASAKARPAGGLVERVAYAMGPQSQTAMDAGELPHGAARAAIREVVAALRHHAKSPHVRVMTFEAAADWLEQEADRG